MLKQTLLEAEFPCCGWGLARVWFRNRKSPKAGPNPIPAGQQLWELQTPFYKKHTGSILTIMRCQAKLRGKILPENHFSYQHSVLPDPSNKTLSPRGTQGWCHPNHCTSHLPSITRIYFTFNDTCNNRAPLPSSHSRSARELLKQHKKEKKNHNMTHFCKYKAVWLLQIPVQTMSCCLSEQCPLP